jgi:hypothetical protein
MSGQAGAGAVWPAGPRGVWPVGLMRVMKMVWLSLRFLYPFCYAQPGAAAAWVMGYFFGAAITTLRVIES